MDQGPAASGLTRPAPPPRKSGALRNGLLATGSALAGLLLLLGFVWLGGRAHDSLHLPLPGTVAGFALFALVLALTEKFRRTWPPAFTGHVQPVASRLLTHLGLLFVPVGVGIITQADVFRQAWLPILVATVGSTMLGLAVTGWLMHRLTRPPPDKTP